MKRISTISKILLGILVLSVLLETLPSRNRLIVEASSYSGLSVCEASYKKIHGDRLPPNELKCIKKESDGLYLMFNWSLYDGLKVISYGKVESANTKSNDFKTGWRDLQNVDREDYDGSHPYFMKNGVRGEYRYLGWDVNGRPYSNLYFIPDRDLGIDPSEKKWIYRPWDSPLAQQSSRAPSGFSPIFTRNEEYKSPWHIIYNNHTDEVNTLINTPSVKVRHQALPDYYVDNNTEKNIFEYMYVEQMPTSLSPGSGTMFHQSTSNNKIYYQTFYIKPLDASQKQKVGVTSSISEFTPIKSTNLKDLQDAFTWKFNLKGWITDDNYIKTDLDLAKYYTRRDIKEWRLEVTYTWPGGSETETLSSLNNGQLALSHMKKTVSRTPELSITFDKSKIDDGDKLVISLTAKAYYDTPDSSVVFDSHTTTYTKTFTETPPPIVPDPPTPPEEPTIPPLVCSFTIPDDAFDIVPFSGTSDSTDLSRVTMREVTVNGASVDPEEFWSGDYVFGDDADGLATVAVKWTPKDVGFEWTEMCDTYRIVNVHDTKPRAQFKLYGGTFKENRKMSIEHTSYDPNANDPFVQAAYPIVDADWTWTAIDGTDSDRKMRTDTKDSKVFLYKNAGEYQVTLTVTNALGRTSEPYVLPFSVLEDFDPAVIMHPYSSEIARNEPLSLMYDGVSTDGDIVTKHDIKVYYDEKGDGSFSKLVDTFNSPISQYIPSKSALGQYRIVSTVEEEFGQETLSEFINDSDKRVTTKQFEFEIDNYIPYSDISTDIPSIRQQVDVGILLDKNLKQSKIDYVKSNGVGINNLFRYEGIDPSINLWDMHTYTYSQSASTSSNSGSSYPSSSTSYCSGGYCGTLSLYSTSDNGSYHDFGSNQRVVDVPGHSIPWCDGADSYGRWWSHAPPCDISAHNSSKWIPATYKTVWVPDVRWISNYYGYYSGTIYKYVRQSFTNPYTRTTADRYLVYISDSSINELSDFNMVKGLSDAKIILVGANAIKSASNYDHYISGSKSIEDVINEVVEYIASHNPPTASQTVLVDESFNMLTDESDPENDAIVQRQTMYVHDQNYFDNPMGKASFALEEYDASKWTSQTLRIMFSLPGEYKVYRRVKDQPSTNPNFSKYSYWSNEAMTIIRVHRKPIALAELDWTYDPSCNCYNTTWVDKSYDLDHNVNDPVNRGIVERKIKYTVGGNTYYQIPNKLIAGNYQLEYVVKDVEGIWSDPFILNFTLASVPPVQLKGKLKSKLSVFSTNSIPASEELTVYDIWTRYPYSTSLDINITNPAGTANYSTVKHVDYFTGTKTGNDIFWADENHLIPATLADGNYAVKLKANGTSSQANTQLLLPFTVFTPIQLTGQIDATISSEKNLSTLIVNDTYSIKATTTKYPNTTTVIAFKGTSYQRSFTLSSTTSNTVGYGAKNWSNTGTFTIPKMPDGRYTFEWTSRTPNGKVETVSKQIEIVNNRPPTADFSWSPQSVFEGDTVSFTSTIQDLDGDTLSVVYELISPSGVSYKTTHSLQSPSYSHNRPVQRLTELGSWRMRLSVSDGKAPPVIVEKSIPVRLLHVGGQVQHTELWNKHRQEYNRKKSGDPESPRGYGVFWAGEKFVLSADTTVTGTMTRANRVEVSFGEFATTLSARDASSTIWGGEMWDEAFESSLPEGTATFTFTAFYSNGTVKTTNATIELRGGVSQIIGVHRVQ